MELVYPPVIGVVLAAFRAMAWDVRVTGEEHVPADGPAVIATNHVGYLDFIFVGYGARRANPRRFVRFAAKKEVFDHAVSGPLMRGMRHIPVDRGGRATESISVATQRLRDGDWVGMFPEATINRSFVPGEGKTGAARMAMAAGVPIVPGAVWGSQRLWTKGRPRDLRRDVVVQVAFGAPMHPGHDDDPVEVTAALMDRIRTLVDGLQRDHPQAPEDDDDRWWLPAHLGGTAPTPEEAHRAAVEEAERRRARRAAELGLPTAVEDPTGAVGPASPRDADPDADPDPGDGAAA